MISGMARLPALAAASPMDGRSKRRASQWSRIGPAAFFGITFSRASACSQGGFKIQHALNAHRVREDPVGHFPAEQWIEQAHGVGRALAIEEHSLLRALQDDIPVQASVAAGAFASNERYATFGIDKLKNRVLLLFTVAGEIHSRH